MQSRVLTFVIINVDSNFLSEVKRGTVREFDAFEVGRKDVIVFAGGNALREFAIVVGVHFPSDLLGLVFGTADLHLDTVDGMIIGSPDGSEDEGIGLRGLGVPLR
jgi:hypothetical protein